MFMIPLTIIAEIKVLIHSVKHVLIYRQNNEKGNVTFGGIRLNKSNHYKLCYFIRYSRKPGNKTSDVIIDYFLYF